MIINKKSLLKYKNYNNMDFEFHIQSIFKDKTTNKKIRV